MQRFGPCPKSAINKTLIIPSSNTHTHTNFDCPYVPLQDVHLATAARVCVCALAPPLHLAASQEQAQRARLHCRYRYTHTQPIALSLSVFLYKLCVSWWCACAAATGVVCGEFSPSSNWFRTPNFESEVDDVVDVLFPQLRKVSHRYIAAIMT